MTPCTKDINFSLRSGKDYYILGNNVGIRHVCDCRHSCSWWVNKISLMGGYEAPFGVRWHHVVVSISEHAGFGAVFVGLADQRGTVTAVPITSEWQSCLTCWAASYRLLWLTKLQYRDTSLNHLLTESVSNCEILTLRLQFGKHLLTRNDNMVPIDRIPMLRIMANPLSSKVLCILRISSCIINSILRGKVLWIKS